MIALARDSGIRHLVDFGCRSAGISVQPEYEVALVTSALALVEVGAGFSILSANALSVVRERPIVARPLSQPTVTREISMIVRQGRALSPAAAEWLHRLQREVRAMANA